MGVSVTSMSVSCACFSRLPVTPWRHIYIINSPADFDSVNVPNATSISPTRFHENTLPRVLLFADLVIDRVLVLIVGHSLFLMI
jgi:hypothetical protein